MDTTTDIRQSIAALALTVRLDGECATDSSLLAIARMNRLAEVLQTRGHACLMCAFGLWDKSPKCLHP